MTIVLIVPPARLGSRFSRSRVDFSRKTASLRVLRANNKDNPMRSIISLYFVIGILLLIVGYFATGTCPNKNTDVVNDVVFVLTWPVELYGYVITGPMSPDEWLHKQACEGGFGQHGSDLPKTQPQ
jgi:hypothetical protein